MPVRELTPEEIADIRLFKKVLAISAVISSVWIVCFALIIYWEDTTEFNDRALCMAAFPWLSLLLTTFFIIYLNKTRGRDISWILGTMIMFFRDPTDRELVEWAMSQDPPNYQIINEVLDRLDPPRVLRSSVEEVRAWQERHGWLDELNASADTSGPTPPPPAKESNTDKIEEEEEGPSGATIRRSGWKRRGPRGC